MTGEELHHEREDQVLAHLLEDLDSHPFDPGRRFDSAAEETLYREYLELCGLLSYALEEAVPAPSTKSRILAAAATPAPQRDIGDLTLVGSPRRAAPASGPTRVTTATENGEATSPSSGSELKPWLYAMAAMLALCVLGLSLMVGRLSELTRTTGELQSAVQQAAQDSMTPAELVQMRDRFNMITTVARQAYPMRPPDDDRAAKGTIFVCGAHQQWYLNLHDLEPPPPEKQYSLWFLTEEGTIHGGVLEVDANASAELEAPTMPQGTHGFAVTLEEQGLTDDQPKGPYVLLGENAVSL